MLSINNYTPTQIGENCHVEYGWSESIQELITQFSFQLTRTDKSGIFRLEFYLKEILSRLKNTLQTGTIPEKEVARGYLSIIYRMIGHTRDIITGKGECLLTYMMIYTWYYYFPELAKFALKCLVDIGDNIHQYGSWKDIKYFCEYIKNTSGLHHHDLIDYAIKLVNDQIQKDYTNLISNSLHISLAAKWVPREKSSFGWLYEQFAADYFHPFLITANTDERMMKAIIKCKTEYRKILSGLNREIDTVQIKQCSKTWSTIDFNKVTSVTLSKQNKAFLNVKQNGDIRCPDDFDRIFCSENITSHIQKSIECDFEIKGKRIGMADFTKLALKISQYGSQIEKDILNSQWRDNSNQNDSLSKMIAMIDVSGSMEGDPMNAAIAIGIRIAEKSLLGKRVMTFSSNPTWINLESYPDFISQVEVIKKAQCGMNKNFYAALDMILDAIIQNKMSSDDVEDMVLVILSDTQIESIEKDDNKSLYEVIKINYEAAGIHIHGKPYKPPHIVFWNLRSTTGFPTLANQSKTLMISGFSPVFLNLFCDKELHSLHSYTPWSLLIKSLENERYKIMHDKLYHEINV